MITGRTAHGTGGPGPPVFRRPSLVRTLWSKTSTTESRARARPYNGPLEKATSRLDRLNNTRVEDTPGPKSGPAMLGPHKLHIKGPGHDRLIIHFWNRGPNLARQGVRFLNGRARSRSLNEGPGPLVLFSDLRQPKGMILVWNYDSW